MRSRWLLALVLLGCDPLAEHAKPAPPYHPSPEARIAAGARKRAAAVAAEASRADAGAAARPDGAPAAPADAGPPTGPPSGAEFDTLVRLANPQLAACAKRARTGKVSLLVEVAPTGFVSTVTAQGAPPEVASCMEGIARGLRLRPFVGPPVTMTVPLSW